MPVTKILSIGTILLYLLPGLAYTQTVLKLPEILTKAEKRVSVNCLLGKTGAQLPDPWIVYSDRERAGVQFGEKYFVTEERETEVHIYKARSCKNRKLISAEDQGWRRKADLLVSLGADFTGNSLIHKKCVILNHHKTIERIKRGEVSESEVPLYRSSTATESADHVPLYLIYFVYKVENNRYLLGKDYKFDPDLPFSEQIVGWVDRDRVFDYNNRICFEPAFDEADVAWRRCHPVYAAKVFEFESELSRFLKGDTSVKPMWVEPDYYFFRNPGFEPDKPGNKEAIDLTEKSYTPALLKRLCETGGEAEAIRQSRLLTGRSLPGSKFRFPLIRMEHLPENVFLTGVTGRFENDHKSKTLLCETLRNNKSQIAVYFILDNSVDRNRLTYVIGQIQQEFTGFQKKFGVCFYPRPQLGKYKVSIGEKGSNAGVSNYQYVRNFIRDFSSESNYEKKHDHALNTLKYVLTNEKFNASQTNIVIMVNNHAIPIPDTSLAGLRRDIQHLMAEKNCYLLAFDYQSDNNLVQQIQEISVAAAKGYAEKLGMGSGEVAFVKTEIGYELKNAGLLTVIEQADSSLLAAAQMQTFLQKGYASIVNTLDNAIAQICLDASQPSLTSNRHEDPFQRALSEVPGMEGKVQYIRALEEGYSAIRFDLPGGGYRQDIWKANVLMTKPELEALGSLLDKMLVQNNNSAFSRALFDLWIALFNRFVGDNLAPEDLMPLTPQIIMNRILGESFGYPVNEPLKRFPLERILANDQGVQKYFESYKEKLYASSIAIREILASGRLKFSLADDAASANQQSSKRGIYYYWVPMEILP